MDCGAGVAVSIAPGFFGAAMHLAIAAARFAAEFLKTASSPIFDLHMRWRFT
jgi:hypothetical protein